MKNFKKLKIWQRGMDIVVLAYQLGKALPTGEKFGLSVQITKAAVSIPSNIAEGSPKSSKLDYKRFLEVSLGSAYELETQVLITGLIGYGKQDIGDCLLKEVDEEQKMIQRFIKTVSTHDS
jgi:four helix bundle protein